MDTAPTLPASHPQHHRLLASRQRGRRTRRTDDIRRSSSPAQQAYRSSTGVGQRLHNDATCIEQAGESRLSSAASAHLADDPCGHDDPLLLACHLDDRSGYAVVPLHCDQRSGVEHQAQRCSASAKHETRSRLVDLGRINGARAAAPTQSSLVAPAESSFADRLLPWPSIRRIPRSTGSCVTWLL